MNECERKMIDAYLPHGRDPELKFNEYYAKDTADRVHKVFICDIFCLRDGDEYGVYEVGTKRRIDSGWNDIFRGFTKGRLYDNREDCKDSTHDWYDNWEYLRNLKE